MFIEPGTVLETGLTLYENRRKLLSLLGRITRSVHHGKLLIVTFGPGGAGKTTLAAILSRGFSVRHSPENYTESIGTETYGYQGEIIGKILVPPGQERRRDATWSDVYQRLFQARNSIIINVVSWGYHSFGLSYLDTRYPSSSEAAFMAAYLPDRRGAEIEIVRALTPRITDIKGKVQMITLVTKQDLWWSERADVKRHYQDGDYNAEIEKILKIKGSQNFEHEYLSASLVISNLRSGVGELMASTTAGYDQNIQLVHLDKLLSVIKSFAID